MFAKNYKINSKEFSPLSDIMGQDYETGSKYEIYINNFSVINRLFYTYRDKTSVPTTDMGRELQPFTTITVDADTGDEVFFKVANMSVDIEIKEIV